MNTRAKNIVQDIQQQYPSEEELEIHKITEIIDFQVLAIMAGNNWAFILISCCIYKNTYYN